MAAMAGGRGSPLLWTAVEGPCHASQKEIHTMAFPIHSRLTRRSALQWVGATGLTMVGLPGTVSRAALDTIHVAVVVDTSGAGGVYGAPVLKGMLLAATEINARGGVNGHALDLTVSDGRSDLARVSALVRHACHDTSM